MITIAIPLFKHASTIGIVGPLEVLGREFLARAAQASGGLDESPFLTPLLVGLNERPVVYSNGVTLRPHKTIAQCPHPDVVLVPPLGDDLEKTLKANGDFVPWLIEAHRRGSSLVSLCTGAFMLGQTGLLDGMEATTHWIYGKAFARLFPKVRLRTDRVIVEQERIITAGPGASFFNLAVYMVEKYCGHETAVMSAKLMLIDPSMNSQLPYAQFSCPGSHGDMEVVKVQNFIEKHHIEPLTLEQMAEDAGLSIRSLTRRFKVATGLAPLGYLQRVRIEAAKRRLEREKSSVDEIRYQVGYEDGSSFRRLFKRHTGLTPKEYRTKFAPQSIPKAS